MSASTVTALSGAIAKLLTRECSDAAQLADLATVLRIVREAVRDEQAIERIDWCLLDLAHFATVRAESEREAEDEDNNARRRKRAMATLGGYCDAE